ncbi:DNA primase [Buchnera aphidicola (Nipponaphis monzeni)]|uniref:DNA primase n=1 Tax=Buchnera aphidicola (Nipponaphis monzeni) TaxID=2495405 RepID=A0A455T9R0_9GAMM|nr:DNA primase [Buchnera aphidicola]BBI01062.1 DNA primase [Buchnera aphidicola (Nipponaphis monzeni)]
MFKKISKNIISELLAKTNIVELIQSKIILKKRGKEFITKCPFHNDNNPSFTVSYEKQFYYCFGCNAHGNAIDFLMHYDNLSFLETIEELSTIHGLQIYKIIPNQINNIRYTYKNELYNTMQKISKIYVNNINQKPGKVALQYLYNRGIDINLIKFFSIGYVSQLTYNCFNDSQKKMSVDKLKLIDSGIIFDKKGCCYNRFYKRIIFPIRDKRGRIGGFGGRSLHNVKPKYLNSPETIIFKKKYQLYGLYEVFKTNNKIHKLLVVEGYIDVIMLFQFNINYAVATLGTSLTSENIQTLFRITDTIIYCYDGDSAGRIAAWKALKLSLPYLYDNKILKFIFLPEGEDPDSLIQKEGQITFESRINNAVPMSKFLFKKLQHNINLNYIEEKSYFSTQIIPLIQKIPGKIIKILLFKKLSDKIGIVNDVQLRCLFLKKKANIYADKLTNIKYTTIKILMSLLVQNPWLVNSIPQPFKFVHFKMPGVPFFLELLNLCMKYSYINTGQLIEFYRPSKKFEIVKKIAKWDNMIVNNQIENVFLDALTDLCSKGLEIRQENLIIKERAQGLDKKEKIELWNINKELAKV